MVSRLRISMPALIRAAPISLLLLLVTPLKMIPLRMTKEISWVKKAKCEARKSPLIPMQRIPKRMPNRLHLHTIIQKVAEAAVTSRTNLPTTSSNNNDDMV